MGAATTDFFEALRSRGHEPLLEMTTGTIGLDLSRKGTHEEHWHVSVDKGDVAVSHKRSATDCNVRAPAALFDRIARGEENAFAAALRGDVVVDGDSKLLVGLQRLFPGPSREGHGHSGT